MLRHFTTSLLTLVASLVFIAPALAIIGEGAAEVTVSTPGAGYVGIVQYTDGTGPESSGVYLGNGYVLTTTAAGPGAFALDENGPLYQPIANSAVSIGTTDLVLYRISGAPSLPPLTLATSASPVGTEFDFIGAGGGTGEKTYGVDEITDANYSLTQVVSDLRGPITMGTTTTSYFREVSGPATGDFVNHAELGPYSNYGDDGGGAFTDMNGNLVLIGINDAFENKGSDFVRISDYSSIIAADMAPEPSAFWLAAAGLALLGLWLQRRRDLVRNTGR